jgi:hypothetical protein
MFDLAMLAKWGVLAAALGGVAAYRMYNPNYKDDNVIEEIVEIGLEKATGVNIDLTPESKEK